jgi:hypothetical protein
MSERSAKTIVLVTGAFLFAAVFLKRDQIHDQFRYTWAAAVITLGLSVLADLAPEIAGPFALLTLIAVYWRNRGLLGSRTAFGSVIQQGTAAAPSASAPAPSAPSPGGVR